MMIRSNTFHAAALAASAAAIAATAGAQTPVGTNIDSRVVAAFDAPDAAVQAWMPEGWTAKPISGGPLAGADLLLVLIDQHVARDADGVDMDPPAALGAALATLGSDGAEKRLFVLRIYTDREGSNPYGNSVAAAIDLETTRAAPAEGARRASQLWTIRPESGGALTVEMTHAPGAPNWGPGEARPYSAKDPDFSRLYAFSQLTDLAMSEALQKPLDGTLTIDTNVAELGALFDGSHRLVGLLDVPLYLREVSLPRDLRQTPRRIP